MKWQPGRLKNVHGIVDPTPGIYHDEETIAAMERKVSWARPYDWRKAGWKLADLRKELDCPQGTEFWQLKNGDLVCKCEFLTD